MSQFGATAIGIANIAMNGEVLDTWYPTPELVPASTSPSYTERLGAQDLPPKLLSLVRLDEDRLVEQVAVRTYIGDLDTRPSTPTMCSCVCICCRIVWCDLSRSIWIMR